MEIALSSCEERSAMDFHLPPRIYNENGEKRRVGFELEFGGLPLESTAQILLLLFGGSLHRLNEFEFHLDTTLGRFVLEADSSFLKEGKHEKYFKAIGLDEAVAGLAGKIIPFEIATPPLPIDNLTSVDRIRSELQQHSAKGTKSSLFMAFGMQFNPEVPARDAETIHSYLKAFFLLYDWLYEVSEISIARRVAPFIHEFSEDYAALILHPRYRPSLSRLIDDYLEYNPTRNRPLDLLPLFAQIDPDRVFAAPVERELVKPRPTFHYRLPNSMVDDPHWSIASDWNKWVEIEKLANDPARIREMADDYFRTKDESLIFTRAKWVEKTRHWLHENL
jgi:hypothetical protein